MESERDNKVPDATAVKRKNIGVKVDEAVWRRFRALALAQGKTAGDLLDELMTEYVEKHRSQAP